MVRYQRSAFGSAPFPTQVTKTLTYCENISIFSTLGAAGNIRMVANGLFDPNQSGLGHQPRYFDQLMAIYNHYVVIESEITVTLVAPATNQNSVGIAALFIDDDATAGISPLDIIGERPGAIVYTRNNSIDSFPTMSLKWKAANVFSGNPQSKSELTGSASANPSEQSVFFVYFNDTSGTSTTVRAQVTIKYKCVFFELTSVSPS